MIKRIAFLLVMFTVVISAQSHGTVYEGQKLNSEILGKEVSYTIYLPYDYETSTRYYPVVYLLHGYTDDDSGWLQYGEVNSITDQEIVNREIPPMIIVTPDAGVSWYINNYDGSVKYEDFFIKEFIPFIESKYRIRTKKRFRAVAGLSMGGYGSLVYAFKHPDMFSSAAPLSAAVYSKDQILSQNQERWDRVFGILYGPGLSGEKRLNDVLKNNNPLFMLDSLDASKLKQVKYYIDCGDDDYLSVGNCELHLKMKKLGIPHEFRVRDGRHSWTYWRTGLPGALKFIGAGFHLE